MEDMDCCGYCRYYNGEIDDGTQFCDELETFVDATGFSCNRFKRREEDNE